MIAKSKATWFTIDKPGDISCDTILTLPSIMPVGVGERQMRLVMWTWLRHAGCGGGEMYALAGLVGMEGGGGVDFSRDAWRRPKDEIGLVLVFGAMAGKGLVDVAANLDIVCRTYVRYAVKPFLTMSSNSFRVDGSPFNSQSKYWHISRSIWFISLSLPDYAP